MAEITTATVSSQVILALDRIASEETDGNGIGVINKAYNIIGVLKVSVDTVMAEAGLMEVDIAIIMEDNTTIAVAV